MSVFQTIESPARRPGQSSEKIVSLVDPEKAGTNAALMFIKHVPKIVNGPFSSGRSATICYGKNKPKHPCKNNTTSLCMEASSKSKQALWAGMRTADGGADGWGLRDEIEYFNAQPGLQNLIKRVASPAHPIRDPQGRNSLAPVSWSMQTPRCSPIP
jgi:hypothetical protein